MNPIAPHSSLPASFLEASEAAWMAWGHGWVVSFSGKQAPFSLHAIRLLPSPAKSANCRESRKSDELLPPISVSLDRALCAVIRGGDFSADLLLCPVGTEFQAKVWGALLRIPRGATRTYGQIAVEIGHPKAVRAVGSACAANPIPFFIPCHRVVPALGGLGNYAHGRAMKEKLLAAEAQKT